MQQKMTETANCTPRYKILPYKAVERRCEKIGLRGFRNCPIEQKEDGQMLEMSADFETREIVLRD